MQGRAAGDPSREEQHPATPGLQGEEINTNSEGRLMCDMITSTLTSVDNVTTLIEGSRKFVGV